VTHRGYENCSSPDARGAVFAMIVAGPGLYASLGAYFARQVREDGVALSRREVIADRDWYSSADHQVVHRTLGVDHLMWCFRSLESGPADEYSGAMLYRAHGRRDFSPRERALVREAHAAIAPLVGGPLARFGEPSPLDLAPRVRHVLSCLLEGDGDKQIAARLGLSVHTVNQYAKAIFKHFGVQSRPELLARWLRRAYPAPRTWIEPASDRPWNPAASREAEPGSRR
jgi:DNA-binding CsgD family transcriptional regulator